MPNRDFIDDDLVKPREDLNRIRMGPADEPARAHPDAPAPEGPSRSVSDLDLPLMARHKQTLDTQAAHTAEEIERLHRLQEDLEGEKRQLEDARKKQQDFVKGRRELVEHLHQSMITLERNELKASQLAELLQSTRLRFRAMLEEITTIREEAWNDNNVREEIGKALVRIDDARMDYNKAMARLEAVGGDERAGGEPHRPVIFEESSPHRETERGFGHWVLIGVAVSLPLIVTLAVLMVLFLMHSNGMM